MSVIDADTHVDESESTWAALEGTPYDEVHASDGPPCPTTRRTGPVSTPPHGAVGWWRAGCRTARCGTRSTIRRGCGGSSTTSKAELAHMDEMGVDIQVIFPTFFIRHNTDNAEAEWALATTYNRWLAEKCAPTNGRLAVGRGAAVAESGNGRRSRSCAGPRSTAPAASSSAASTSAGKSPTRISSRCTRKPTAWTCRMCFHTGHPLPSREWDRGFPIMYAFAELVTSKVPEMFPNVRFGFIESGHPGFPT